MSQTKEQRIYKHYQSKRHLGKLGNRRGGDLDFGLDSNDDRLILWLARHWKMRCIDIKTIVREFQKQNKEKHNAK